jgi:UDP-glucose 4-epimerase
MGGKSYLIVGGGGFVGRRLTARLEVEPRARVVWLVRSRSGDLARPRTLLLEDLRSDPNLLASFDEVVYAASATVPSTVGATAHGEVEENLRPLCELLGLLEKAPEAGFTYISSAGTVYDTTLGRAREDSPTRPLSNYAAGKLAAEGFVRVFGVGRPGRVSVARAANLYGPGQEAKPGFGLIPAICRSASEGSELVLHRGGRDRRDYLHIDDFCEGLVAAMGGPGGVYNLARGESHSALEVIAAFASATGVVPATRESEGTSSPAGDVLLDVSRSREVLGWTAKVSLEEGIRSTWQWWCGREARGS